MPQPSAADPTLLRWDSGLARRRGLIQAPSLTAARAALRPLAAGPHAPDGPLLPIHLLTCIIFILMLTCFCSATFLPPQSAGQEGERRRQGWRPAHAAWRAQRMRGLHAAHSCPGQCAVCSLNVQCDCGCAWLGMGNAKYWRLPPGTGTGGSDRWQGTPLPYARGRLCPQFGNLCPSVCAAFAARRSCDQLHQEVEVRIQEVQAGGLGGRCGTARCAASTLLEVSHYQH